MSLGWMLRRLGISRLSSGGSWIADFVGGFAIDGVAVTATAAQLNSAAGEGTDIDAGASGTAGSVDIFPATAAKGKLRLVAADNTGDTALTITNVAQAAARTYTIPDAGASGRYLVHAGIVGDGLMELVTEEATVSVSGAETATGLTFPAGSLPFVAQANLETVVTATTAVKIGLDIASGSSGYGIAAALTKNTKLRQDGAGFGGVYNQGTGWAPLAAAKPLLLIACDNAGSAAGTLDSGSVRVRISYWKVSDLVNAA